MNPSTSFIYGALLLRSKRKVSKLLFWRWLLCSLSSLSKSKPTILPNYYFYKLSSLIWVFLHWGAYSLFLMNTLLGLNRALRLLLLLQPRKFYFKHRQKKRQCSSFKERFLTFGSAGLKILQNLRLNSKQIFRLKIYLKKSVRKSDFTKRKVWFNSFPHLPLSKKSKGIRMGKGVGKLSIWFSQVSAGVFLLEFKNLRFGRVVFFSKQVATRLAVRTKIVNTMSRPLQISRMKKVNAALTHFA